MGEETVNVGTKFIIRDIAEQVGDHVEKLFSWDQGWDLKLFSWDQGWDAGTKGKGVGVALSEEVHTEGTLSHLYRAVLLGLCLPSGHLPCFFFHTWLTVGPFSGVCMHLWAKMGRARPFMAWSYSLNFNTKNPSCTCVLSPLSCTLKGLCFSLALLYVLSWSVKKREKLAIYLVCFVIAISKCKYRSDCKFLSCNPPISYLRKCKERAGWL